MLGDGQVHNALGIVRAFSESIRQFRQCLGLAYTNRDGNSRPLSDSMTYVTPISVQVAVATTGEVQEGFVNGIDFNLG
jgi:hypothetical protein